MRHRFSCVNFICERGEDEVGDGEAASQTTAGEFSTHASYMIGY